MQRTHDQSGTERARGIALAAAVRHVGLPRIKQRDLVEQTDAAVATINALAEQLRSFLAA